MLRLVELRRGRTVLVGDDFVLGLGATVILLTTTHAYALALVQRLFPLVGLDLLRGRSSAPKFNS